MECGICLNENILEKDMHYTECLHCLCFDCFEKLRTNKCPFCRDEISILYYSFGRNNDYRYLNIEDDSDSFDEPDDYNIPIPIIRRDRQEYRRNKRQRKIQRLNNLLNETRNIPNTLPNLRKRNNRKKQFL